MPAHGPDGARRGYVIPIGGAEKKRRKPAILERFVHLCGGDEARIVVLPTASELDDTGPVYVDLFERLGAGSAVSVRIEQRADAARQEYVDETEEATGIFITGGNQLRLSTILGGTPIAQAVRRRNAAGVHVAGTSAGAAIISEHMIAGGFAGATPTPDKVTLAPGLGLTNAFVIDQHFRQRDRLGRLLAALAYNPFMTGIGLDEDTAAFIGPDGVFEVVGSGAVTVVDPSNLAYSSMGTASRGEAVTLIGLNLHILTHGDRYDAASRTATAGS
ncbi:MAG: cyanophycinase [Rhodothermales bacterium]